MTKEQIRKEQEDLDRKWKEVLFRPISKRIDAAMLAAREGE